METLRHWGWRGVAVLAFIACVWQLMGDVMSRPLGESVPVNIARLAEHKSPYPAGAIQLSDHRFVVWLIGRNARTLVEAPSRLFQAEPCHPADDTLALGEPGIAVGLMGVPMWLLTGDPVATYDFVLVLMMLVSFVSMYLLVREWTGVPAAAVAAALVFAFHEIKLKDTVHFYALDSSWIALALYFTSRLFTGARWRDALGLAFAITMQLTGSLYPTIAAVVVAPPALAWLAWRHGVRQLVPAQWAFVVVWTAILGWLVFTPYLSMSDAGVLESRPLQHFWHLPWLLPDGPGFTGWLSSALIIVCLAMPRRFVPDRAGGDVRWLLLGTALVLAWLSLGANDSARLAALAAGEPLPREIPSLYGALAALLPGLDKVRGPGAIWCGVHVMFCVLTGLGMAALLRVVGDRYRTPLALALLLAIGLDTMRPAAFGMTPRLDYASFEMRPPDEELALYDRLEAQGNRGPILELPFDPRDISQSSRALLVAAYHHRRISQCLNSYLPPEVEHVKVLSDRLPEVSALRELAALGFTTIVVQPDPPERAPARRRRWQRELAEAAPGMPIRRVAADAGLAVYEILPAAD
jgi:hypothetical protein